MSQPRILVVDDEPSIRRTLRDLLEMQDYVVDEAKDGVEAVERLASHVYDAALLDVHMPRLDGLGVLEVARDSAPGMPIIMLTGHGTVETAVRATRLGAYDFMQKPPKLNRLLVTVRNALDRGELEEQNKRMRSQIARSNAQVPAMLGSSPAMERIKLLLERAAPSDSRVLVTGEPGTGKELVARWIHHLSNRSAQSFVAVNCAAIPADLIESELFGHEKGAFTGASRQQIGTFEQADRGTLFLDEVGDMAPSAQAKVLRALQEGRFKRVGGDREIQVDVRVVAATNKDLESEIAEGRFRDDLFHRLSVIHFHLPPLRERSDDIPELVLAFQSELAARTRSDRVFGPQAISSLKQLPWRGNIRELRNAVERLLVLSAEDTITNQDVQLLVQPGRRTSGSLTELVDHHDRIADFRDAAEKAFLERKLTLFDWNISKMSETIELQRSNLYGKLKRYGITRKG